MIWSRGSADPGGPPLGTLALWAALYIAASVLFCAPFVSPWQLDTMPDWGDARLNTWTLAWHARWPVAGGWPYDAPFFAPESTALANTEPMVALGLAAAPVTLLAGPIVAFNLLRLLLPVVNALAMAGLVWHYTRDRWSAFVAGAALGFAYSQLATVYIGLIQLAVLAGFALVPVHLDRWWRQGHGKWLALAVTLAWLQALMSWYAAVLMVLVVLVQLAWLVVTERPTGRALLGRLALLVTAATIAAVLLWPFATPFFDMVPPTLDELRRFSLEPSFYLSPPRDTWAGALMTGHQGEAGPWDYRRSYFPGLITVVAALAGIAAAVANIALRRLLWAVPLGLVALSLSFGPSSPGEVWRPFDLISALPGISSFRVPGRMAVLVAVALAMLVGGAVAATPRRFRGLVGVVLLAGFAAEGVMVHRPRPAPAELPTPPVFARLAAEAPTTALVVPMLADTPAWPAEADYLLFARESWIPLANGYGRRTPSIYRAILDTVSAYPPRPLGDALRFYGVSHVVVLPRYQPDRAAAFMAAADAGPDFERLAVVDGDVLYRVRPAATPRP